MINKYSLLGFYGAADMHHSRHVENCVLISLVLNLFSDSLKKIINKISERIGVVIYSLQLYMHILIGKI